MPRFSWFPAAISHGRYAEIQTGEALMLLPSESDTPALAMLRRIALAGSPINCKIRQSVNYPKDEHFRENG
jgi:hypothetical protein